MMRALTLWQRSRGVGPGLLVSALVAMAAAFLGSHYKGSVLLFALLLVMALGFVGEEERCKPGIQFAGTTVLRIGVALLGLRLTAEHVSGLGWANVIALAVAVLATMAFALLLARVLRIQSGFGVQAGGATAICGASAALAIASVLPRRERLDRDTSLTVIGVTTLSTVAMIAYPVLSASLGFDGAGYAISQAAGDAATTKLIRIAMLMPTLLLVAARALASNWNCAQDAAAAVVCRCLRHTGPRQQQRPGSDGSTDAGRHGVAGGLGGRHRRHGLKTSLRDVTVLDWRPVPLLVLSTVWLATLAAIYLRFVV